MSSPQPRVHIIVGSLEEEIGAAKIAYVSHSKCSNFLQNDEIHLFFFLNESLESILTPYKRKFQCGACVLFLRVLKLKTMIFCRMFQLCRPPPQMIFKSTYRFSDFCLLSFKNPSTLSLDLSQSRLTVSRI